MGEETNNLQAVTGKGSKQDNSQHELNSKVENKGCLAFVYAPIHYFHGHGAATAEPKAGEKPTAGTSFRTKLNIKLVISVAGVITAITASIVLLSKTFVPSGPDTHKDVGKAAPGRQMPSGKKTPVKMISFRVGSSYRELNSDFAPLAEACQEHPFVNSLGMRLVPFELVKSGTRPVVLFAECETTVGQFTQFAEETGFPEVATESREMDGQRVSGSWKRPGFPEDFTQTSEHPVIWVNWNEARAFCHWLTKREQAKGEIPLTWSYDLPLVEQWTKTFTLIYRSASNLKKNLEGNWGDLRYGEAAGNRSKFAWKRVTCPALDDYNDGEIFTSVVGTVQKNQHQNRLLWDMPGNVWEMTLGTEPINTGGDGYAALGGAWDYGKAGEDPMAEAAEFKQWFGIGRGRKVDGRYADVGFRCVLGPKSDQAPQ